MKKRMLLVALLALILQVFWVGAASAEYKSEYDITISVTILEDYIETSDSTGEATFEIQESAHEEITDSTGQEVDHSYIWLEVNGSKVLAVDPPQPWIN